MNKTIKNIIRSIFGPKSQQIDIIAVAIQLNNMSSKFLFYLPTSDQLEIHLMIVNTLNRIRWNLTPEESRKYEMYIQTVKFNTIINCVNGVNTTVSGSQTISWGKKTK